MTGSDATRNIQELSVVVPTHGRVDLFLATLESLRRQHTDAFELIVTDDSDRVSDQEAIRRAVDDYGRDTGRQAAYLFTRASLGQAANTNQGLRAAGGKLLRILHSDDLLHPHCLAWEIDRFRRDAPLALLFQDCIPFRQEAAIRWDSPPVVRFVEPVDYFGKFLSFGTAIPSGMVFSRTAYEAVGGMRQDLLFLCDWDFFARLLLWCADHRQIVCSVTAGLCAWRMHDESTSSSRWRDHHVEHAALMREWKEFLPSCRLDLFVDHRDRDRFFRQGESYRRSRLANDCLQLDAWTFLAAVPWLLRYSSPRELRKVFRKAFLRPVRWLRRGKSGEPQPAPARKTGGDDWNPDLTITSDHACDDAEAGSICCVLPYDNSLNTWPIRRHVQTARRIRFMAFNGNRFFRRTLGEGLKLVLPGTEVELRFHDNAHTTWFGVKALMTALHPGRFELIDQNRSPGKPGDDMWSSWSIRYRCIAEPFPWNSHPLTGVTVGILTLGERPEELRRLLESVHKYCPFDHEVIIVSPRDVDTSPYDGPLQRIHFQERDDVGWITRKKNLICERASHTDIVICHDRFELTKGFFESFHTWGHAYGIAGPKVRLPDGRRALDWGIVRGPNHSWSDGGLLEYRDYSAHAYVPGGITMIRKPFWKVFPWAEDLFWNEHEDVELCRRVQCGGEFPRLFPGEVTTSKDRWIDQNRLIPFDDQRDLSD